MFRMWLLCGVLACAGCTERTAPSAGGFQLRPLASPAGAGSREPNLARAPDGRVVLSWIEPDGAGHALRYAVLAGTDWSAAGTVARGESWFVNWADFPSVVPLSDSLWAAHWLVRRPGSGYAYDVAVALSRDGGRSWSAPFAPHTDGTPTEHGFASLFPWQDGAGVVWLDGRETAPGAGHDPGGHAQGGGHGAGAGGMTLRTARIESGGALADEQVLDGLVCDCCQTGVAVGDEGPVVVYRDRDGDEIRDIAVVRRERDRWSAPQRVAHDGWRIDGCPVNGPAIDASGRDVVVAWFTAAGARPRVLFARSTDGGRSFGLPAEVDAEAPLGRVDVALLDDGAAAVSWLAPAGDGAVLKWCRVQDRGCIGPQQAVALTGADRPAGFPRMVARGGELVFAWTEAGPAGRRVRVALSTPMAR